MNSTESDLYMQNGEHHYQGHMQTFKKGGYFVTTPRLHPHFKIIITETAN